MYIIGKDECTYIHKRGGWLHNPLVVGNLYPYSLGINYGRENTRRLRHRNSVVYVSICVHKSPTQVYISR